MFQSLWRFGDLFFCGAKVPIFSVNFRDFPDYVTEDRCFGTILVLQHWVRYFEYFDKEISSRLCSVCELKIEIGKWNLWQCYSTISFIQSRSNSYHLPCKQLLRLRLRFDISQTSNMVFVCTSLFSKSDCNAWFVLTFVMSFLTFSLLA